MGRKLQRQNNGNSPEVHTREVNQTILTKRKQPYQMQQMEPDKKKWSFTDLIAFVIAKNRARAVNKGVPDKSEQSTNSKPQNYYKNTSDAQTCNTTPKAGNLRSTFLNLNKNSKSSTPALNAGGLIENLAGKLNNKPPSSTQNYNIATTSNHSSSSNKTKTKNHLSSPTSPLSSNLGKSGGNFFPPFPRFGGNDSINYGIDGTGVTMSDIERERYVVTLFWITLAGVAFVIFAIILACGGWCIYQCKKRGKRNRQKRADRARRVLGPFDTAAINEDGGASFSDLEDGGGKESYENTMGGINLKFLKGLMYTSDENECQKGNNLDFAISGLPWMNGFIKKNVNEKLSYQKKEMKNEQQINFAGLSKKKLQRFKQSFIAGTCNNFRAGGGKIIIIKPARNFQKRQETDAQTTNAKNEGIYSVPAPQTGVNASNNVLVKNVGPSMASTRWKSVFQEALKSKKSFTLGKGSAPYFHFSNNNIVKTPLGEGPPIVIGNIENTPKSPNMSTKDRTVKRQVQMITYGGEITKGRINQTYEPNSSDEYYHVDNESEENGTDTELKKERAQTRKSARKQPKDTSVSKLFEERSSNSITREIILDPKDLSFCNRSSYTKTSKKATKLDDPNEHPKTRENDKSRRRRRTRTDSAGSISGVYERTQDPNANKSSHGRGIPYNGPNKYQLSPGQAPLGIHGQVITPDGKDPAPKTERDLLHKNSPTSISNGDSKNGNGSTARRHRIKTCNNNPQQQDEKMHSSHRGRQRRKCLMEALEELAKGNISALDGFDLPHAQLVQPPMHTPSPVHTNKEETSQEDDADQHLVKESSTSNSRYNPDQYFNLKASDIGRVSRRSLDGLLGTNSTHHTKIATKHSPTNQNQLVDHNKSTSNRISNNQTPPNKIQNSWPRRSRFLNFEAPVQYNEAKLGTHKSKHLLCPKVESSSHKLGQISLFVNPKLPNSPVVPQLPPIPEPHRIPTSLVRNNHCQSPTQKILSSAANHLFHKQSAECNKITDGSRKNKLDDGTYMMNKSELPTLLNTRIYPNIAIASSNEDFGGKKENIDEEWKKVVQDIQELANG